MPHRAVCPGLYVTEWVREVRQQTLHVYPGQSQYCPGCRNVNMLFNSPSLPSTSKCDNPGSCHSLYVHLVSFIFHYVIYATPYYSKMQSWIILHYAVDLSTFCIHGLRVLSVSLRFIVYSRVVYTVQTAISSFLIQDLHYNIIWIACKFVFLRPSTCLAAVGLAF